MPKTRVKITIETNKEIYEKDLDLPGNVNSKDIVKAITEYYELPLSTLISEHPDQALLPLFNTVS